MFPTKQRIFVSAAGVDKKLGEAIDRVMKSDKATVTVVVKDKSSPTSTSITVSKNGDNFSIKTKAPIVGGLTISGKVTDDPKHQSISLSDVTMKFDNKSFTATSPGSAKIGVFGGDVAIQYGKDVVISRTTFGISVPITTFEGSGNEANPRQWQLH